MLNITRFLDYAISVAFFVVITQILSVSHYVLSLFF